MRRFKPHGSAWFKLIAKHSARYCCNLLLSSALPHMADDQEMQDTLTASEQVMHIFRSMAPYLDTDL